MSSRNHSYGQLPPDKLKREVEMLLAAKELYDQQFPEHFKDMSPLEILEVACERLFETFCEPPSQDDKNKSIRLLN